MHDYNLKNKITQRFPFSFGYSLIPLIKRRNVEWIDQLEKERITNIINSVILINNQSIHNQSLIANLTNGTERQSTDNSNPRLIRTNSCGPDKFELTRIYCIFMFVYIKIHLWGTGRSCPTCRRQTGAVSRGPWSRCCSRCCRWRAIASLLCRRTAVSGGHCKQKETKMSIGCLYELTYGTKLRLSQYYICNTYSINL